MDGASEMSGAQPLPHSDIPSMPRRTGITLSPNQVKRATDLAKERGLGNVTFKVHHLAASPSDQPATHFRGAPEGCGAASRS